MERSFRYHYPGSACAWTAHNGAVIFPNEMILGGSFLLYSECYLSVYTRSLLFAVIIIAVVHELVDIFFVQKSKLRGEFVAQSGVYGEIIIFLWE